MQQVGLTCADDTARPPNGCNCLVAGSMTNLLMAIAAGLFLSTQAGVRVPPLWAIRCAEFRRPVGATGCYLAGTFMLQEAVMLAQAWTEKAGLHGGLPSGFGNFVLLETPTSPPACVSAVIVGLRTQIC